MRSYEHVALGVGEVLLPRRGSDLEKWAVVACDQYTSEPEYWEAVDRFVGGAPSTLRLIYPEVYLERPDREARIASIHQAMRRYLDQGLLEPHDGLLYVERQIGERVRRGLVACVDLEAYDYAKGSRSLIRATEGTIVARIPPRVAIRQQAPLELPHIMVLIDDPQDTVIGALAARRAELAPLYDFELMQRAGRVAGYLVGQRALEQQVVAALQALAAPQAFASRYGLGGSEPVLLYAMGDGNHSLATAKALWEQLKQREGAAALQSPARHALVELVNVHDPALVFEPIHRVLFELRQDVLAALREAFGSRLGVHEERTLQGLEERVASAPAGCQRIGLVREAGLAVIEIAEPSANLAVGTLQQFLDGFVERGGARELDYVHGTETVARLGAQPGNVGFTLPAMSKGELFRTVILDGALPRKTFSMGEAHEKRFYIECRQLG